MSEFRLAKHAVTGRQLVEVWNDGEFIAAFYATDDRAFRIVSKHPMDVEQDQRPPGAIRIQVGRKVK